MRETEYHVLNLGAGVQSTTLYLMSMEGKVRTFDVVIFADTGEEPQAVYSHLKWLQSLNGPPVLIRTRGKLGDDLMHGRNATGHRFASIPAFTILAGSDQEGRTRRSNGVDWTRAVEIDHALRTTGAVANRDMRQTMYVHRSCQPIDEVEFNPRVNTKELQLGFGVECEGVCGV
jgi:hypothetical protein